MARKLTLWISGQPPRKSNSRRIVSRGRDGPPMSIKSQAALDWTNDAIKQIPADARLELGSAAHPLAVEMEIFYASRRPDLSGELVLDMLQHAGVLADDRYVYEWHLYKRIDRELPGVKITIEEI